MVESEKSKVRNEFGNGRPEIFGFPLSVLGFVTLLVFGVTVGGGGCVSKGQARRQEQRAFEQGKETVLRQQVPGEPSVLFQGDVRNQRVPWREGITLAEALLAAQYTWGWDPRTITVTRNGQVHAINPKALLRGADNPLLEPGDLVEVRH